MWDEQLAWFIKEVGMHSHAVCLLQQDVTTASCRLPQWKPDDPLMLAWPYYTHQSDWCDKGTRTEDFEWQVKSPRVDGPDRPYYTAEEFGDHEYLFQEIMGMSMDEYREAHPDDYEVGDTYVRADVGLEFAEQEETAGRHGLTVEEMLEHGGEWDQSDLDWGQVDASNPQAD